MRGAEKLAEETAERISLQRRIESALTEAVAVEALAAPEAAKARQELRQLTLPLLRDLLAELTRNIATQKAAREELQKAAGADDEGALGFAEEEEPNSATAAVPRLRLPIKLQRALWLWVTSDAMVHLLSLLTRRAGGGRERVGQRHAGGGHCQGPQGRQ